MPSAAHGEPVEGDQKHHAQDYVVHGADWLGKNHHCARGGRISSEGGVRTPPWLMPAIAEARAIQASGGGPCRA